MPVAKPWPIEGYLIDRLEAAIAKLGWTLPDAARVEVEVPREAGHGDWATAVALTLAKTVRRPPREVAQSLIGALEVDEGVLAEIQLAGAGFINFRVSQSWLLEVLRRVVAAPEQVGRSEAGRGERVLIEFVSANPTGPLNVVNARAASFGDALTRILNAAGYRASSEFYTNDWGLQTELFGASVRSRFAEWQGLPAPAVPDEGYAGAYVTDLARALDPAQGKAWLALPEREQAAAFGARAIDSMIERQRGELQHFGVAMDQWVRESALHRSGAVADTLAQLATAGYIEERDGARWFRSTAFGDQEDRVVVRSNGEPTYFLADVAYHRDKLARGHDRLIDLLGPDHHGHIPRMKGAIEALGIDAGRLEIILLQMVRLLRGGEVVKMSKRAGEFVTMEDLVEEVGVDAARFFFLMRRAESHLDFDLGLAVRRTEENPVYYVQYAHARVHHVLEYARHQGLAEPDPEHAPLERLSEPETDRLLRGLASFPTLVAGAARHREPHRIPIYLKDLAARFHSFYHQHRVVTSDSTLSAARLILTRATGIVFQRGLGLLGVSAPEAM